ncbi:MAG: 2-hydroxyacid dehydrogenase [Mycobacterium sp.]
MKVLVADANLVPHRDRLEGAVPADAEVCWRVGYDIATLRDELRDADVYVGGRFPAELAQDAEKLRLIHVAGAGTDRIDFAALSPDILVANTFHHERSIAEYIVSAAVLLRRNFLVQDRALRRDVWATSVYDAAIPQPSTVADATVGFVGFGHIGQRAWELFRAFGSRACAVTGSGRVDAAEYGLAWAGDTSRLDRLLRESDVVVVSAPLTSQTEGMIGAEQLRALGPAGVLINVGRGPLVQERALYGALLGGEIQAAAIDVWYRYPGADGRGAPSELPFAELSNVLITPHSSGVTSDTFRGRVDDIAANIGRLSRGEPLRNVVAR